MIYNPAVSDLLVLLTTVEPSDIINLPREVITLPLVITRPCTIMGQGANTSSRTTIDITSIDQSALLIKATIIVKGCHVHLNNIGISNNIDDASCIGLYIENGSIDLSECSISAGKAIYFKTCTSSTLDSISVSGGQLGMLFEDSYGITMANSEVYSADNCLLFQGTSNSISDPPAITAGSFIVDHNYQIQTIGTTNFKLIGATDNIIGQTFKATGVGSGTGTAITPANLRPDRTHDITITNSNFYKSQIAVLYVNADHIAFTSCKIYDITNVGIMQMNNSYSNTYKQGEFYSIASFAVKNSDNQGGVHIMDCTECWWGDLTGPNGGPNAGITYNGIGSKVSKDVLCKPWSIKGTEPALSYPGLRNFVWGMLGAPQVKVELTEQDVTECINMAIDRYLYYLTPDLDYHYFNGPNYGAQEYMLPIEIPKKAIYEVIYQPNSDIFTNLSGSGESFLLTYYMQNTGGTFLSDFYVAMSYKETLERTLGIQPSYEFLSRPINGMVRDFIRIYPKSTYSVRLAIKYSRMLSEYETDAAIWIKKYALAWAKEKLGRVRSKYSSVPGPSSELQLDGGTLLQESQTEKEALILELISWSEPLSFSTG